MYAKFKDKAQKEFGSSAFYYKIPDTAGLGGKRPFDAILVHQGCPFAIEFKSAGDTLKPYQSVCLDMFTVAGGVSFVVTDGDNIEEVFKAMRNIATVRGGGNRV